MYENSNSQEQWIHTSCNGCFSACAIRALRKDGKVVDVKGAPDIESAMGKICGKGIVRIAEAIRTQMVAHFTPSGYWVRDSVGSKERPHLNSPIPLDWSVRTVTGQTDACAKVKIYR